MYYDYTHTQIPFAYKKQKVVVDLSHIQSGFSLSCFRMKTFLSQVCLCQHTSLGFSPLTTFSIPVSASLPLSTHIYLSFTIVHGITAQRGRAAALNSFHKLSSLHLLDCGHDSVLALKTFNLNFFVVVVQLKRE